MCDEDTNEIFEMYETVADKIICLKEVTEKNVLELNKLLPNLREKLVCIVCEKLLSPEFLRTNRCNHFVCAGCKGKEKKKGRDFCKNCREWNSFIFKESGDSNLSTLLKGYKKLCRFIICDGEWRQAIKNESINFTSLALILAEGMRKDRIDNTTPRSVFDKKPNYSSYSAKKILKRKQDRVNDEDSNNSSSSGQVNLLLMSNDMPKAKNPKLNIPNFDHLNPPNGEEDEEDDDDDEEEDDVDFSFLRKQNTSNNGLEGSNIIDPLKMGVSSSNSTFSGGVNNANSPNKKLKVRLPRAKAPFKGCRCGNASAVPGKLTCCGQRCPCYVSANACFDCKCKGCRNPHLPGGKKLLSGINAVVDTKSGNLIQVDTSGVGHSQRLPTGANVNINTIKTPSISIPLTSATNVPNVTVISNPQYFHPGPVYHSYTGLTGYAGFIPGIPGFISIPQEQTLRTDTTESNKPF